MICRTNDFKWYRKTQLQEMRSYVSGEDMTGISVSPADARLPTLDGGMIARNSKDHDDQWYVAAQAFADNYEPTE